MTPLPDLPEVGVGTYRLLGNVAWETVPTSLKETVRS